MPRRGDSGFGMDNPWTKARGRATRGVELRTYVIVIALYIGLGMVLLFFLDTRTALISWGLLLIPFFAVVYYVFARLGLNDPQSFICPGCRRTIPFNSEHCGWCGYSPPTAREVSVSQVTARKVPKDERPLWRQRIPAVVEVVVGFGTLFVFGVVLIAGIAQMVGGTPPGRILATEITVVLVAALVAVGAILFWRGLKRWSRIA
jgi:hypothetical protein